MSTRTQTTDMTEDAIIARLATMRRKPQTAAERTRAWRAAAKASGRPDMKVVDSAIVEATSFLLLLLDELPPEDRSVERAVNIERLVQIAQLVLIGDGYNRKQALICVIERLRPREHHLLTSKLPCKNLPSRDEAIVPPKNGGQWLPKDIKLIRELTGENSSAPPLHPQTA